MKFSIISSIILFAALFATINAVHIKEALELQARSPCFGCKLGGSRAGSQTGGNHLDDLPPARPVRPEARPAGEAPRPANPPAYESRPPSYYSGAPSYHSNAN